MCARVYLEIIKNRSYHDKVGQVTIYEANRMYGILDKQTAMDDLVSRN